MRLSPNGWSNDIPDKPGWYSICRQKEWHWCPSNMYPYLVRVDFIGEKLMVVEDSEFEHCDDAPPPHPLEYDGREDQHWMRRAYKFLGSKESFNVRDIPDVSGIRGYSPDEWDYRPDEKRRRNEHFKSQIMALCESEDAK